MAVVLAVLTSGRAHGFTAQLLEAALEGVRSVPGAKVDYLHTHQYAFGPCQSCFTCIRSPEHVCVLDDDFGRQGEGEVFKRVARCNALLIADPVHNWSPSASARLFIERCYPFLWSGALNGLPAATISCASNQGMHLLAEAELCKWLLGYRARHVGSVATHVAHMRAARQQARALGLRLGRAAVEDAKHGRQTWSDSDCFVHYAQYAPWSPLVAYIENLTMGTRRPEQSVPERLAERGAFKDPEARQHLRKAAAELRRTISLYHLGETVEATRSLVKASAHWTRATWKEFLEKDVIGVAQPETYRPLPEAAE